MQQPKAFNIDSQALNTLAQPADRLVYSYHFVSFKLPPLIKGESHALTPSQIDRAARSTAVFMSEKDAQANTGKRVPKRVRDAAKRLRNQIDHGASSGSKVPSGSSVPVEEQIAGMLGTEFGLLFLDRTRIRPMGFALGEHLTSISLAPGEEITIEQKTFSKTEKSFEETRDEETTQDQELSSSYTNELSESLEWQLSLSKKSTQNDGAKISGSYEGIGAEASTQTASDLSGGDTRTARDSLKLSETNTRKIAAKHRQQHKIVMRLSQESRFESGSKRVVRNANTLAPVDLVYFKIMQRLALAQERYGVRLCWAPTVADPAGRFFAELEKRREAFMATATLVDVGPAPVKPVPPVTAPQQSRSEILIADKFDPVWGGQSHDYTIDIAAPPNYLWDQQPVSLTFGFTASRPGGARILTMAATEIGVRVFVHVGIADCRNPLQPAFWQAQGTATLTLVANFLPTFDAAGNQAYADKLAKYLEDMEAWKAKRDTALAAATARAEEAWAKIRAEAVAGVNIVQEVIGAVIEQAFPSAVRNEPWEIELWEKIFDFDNAGVRFYPSWWNGRELRDPQSGASSFTNASWAKVHIPIRPGAEEIALRWLLAREIEPSRRTRLVDITITKVIDDLRAYRQTHFGGEDEVQMVPSSNVNEPCPALTRPYRCLGRWEELIPTDGTHLEVLQATSSAADDDLKRRLDLQNGLQEQKGLMAAKDVELKGLAADTGLSGMTSHVEIGVPEINKE